MRYKAEATDQDRIFLAALQGVDYGKVLRESRKPKPFVRTSAGIRSTGMFGSPEDYKHLSDEEKRILTEQMKSQVKSLSLGGLKGK